MPTADPLETGVGTQPLPYHPVLLRATSEALAGNGIQSPGDFAVSATATDLEIQIASGTAVYQGSTTALGSATTTTLSAGDADPRYDTVAFDTASGSVTVSEGTADPQPVPPDLSGDEILLAVVFIESGATDVADSDIYNWRTEALTAEKLLYPDTTGQFAASTVDAALDELQEAAQIGSYPLAAGDLAPISASPIPIADLDTPYSLDALTDTDLGTADLTADGGGTTVYSNSADQVPRARIDQDKVSTIVTSASTTTSDEEILLVDTIAIGASSTVTLASADATAGNEIVVVDLSGGASSNPITVDTEGSETIDGASSISIESNHGARVVSSDGANWVSTGGGSGAGGVAVEDDGSSVADPAETLNVAELLTATSTADGVDIDADLSQFFGTTATTNLSDTNQLVVDRAVLADGQTLRIRTCSLTEGVAGAAPSGVDLKLVSFGSFAASPTFVTQATLISGDGSTDYSRVTGDPVGSYTNSTGSDQPVGVIVDNQSGTNHDLLGSANGVID